jgi:hypothetical protein
MPEYRKPGETCAIRGVIDGKVWLVQTMIVVEDNAEETILLLVPGAECMLPEGLLRRRRGDFSLGTRWEEASRGDWDLVPYNWTTNRFYSVQYIWNDARDEFVGYYVNFELPWQRTPCGFDTLDLELDIRVTRELVWRWKDVEDYEAGIRAGCIRPEWVAGIEAAKPDVLAQIERGSYPFDASWCAWRPDPSWLPPHLPAGWDQFGLPSTQD